MLRLNGNKILTSTVRHADERGIGVIRRSNPTGTRGLTLLLLSLLPHFVRAWFPAITGNGYCDEDNNNEMCGKTNAHDAHTFFAFLLVFLGGGRFEILIDSDIFARSHGTKSCPQIFTNISISAKNRFDPEIQGIFV